MKTRTIWYDGRNGDPILLDTQLVRTGANLVREGLATLALAMPDGGFTASEPDKEPKRRATTRPVKENNDDA